MLAFLKQVFHILLKLFGVLVHRYVCKKSQDDDDDGKDQ